MKDDVLNIKLNKKEQFMRYGSPLRSLIYFCGPTIVIMVAISLYNLVDKILAQELAGQNLINNPKIDELYRQMTGRLSPTLSDMKTYINVATQYSYVAFNIGSSVASLFGVGASILYSVEYGKRHYEKMGLIFSNMIIYSLFFSIVTAAFMYLICSPAFGYLLIKIQQGSDQNPITLYLAWRYIKVFIYVLPVMIVQFLLTSILRSQGKILSVFWIILSTIFSNVFLDWIFMKYAKMDLDGAMLATGISWVGNIVLAALVYHHEKNQNLKIQKKYYSKLDILVLKEVFLLGMTPFFIKISSAVFAVITAFFLTHLQGSPMDPNTHTYLLQQLCASMMPWLLIMTNVVVGISQGARIVMAYSYGAKKYLRIKKVLRLAFYFMLGWLLLFNAIFFMFGPWLVEIFAFPSAYAKNYWIYIIINCMSYPFFAITYAAITLFNSIKQSIKSASLSLLRSGIIITVMATIGFFLSDYVYLHLSTTSPRPGIIYFVFCGSNDFVTSIFGLIMFVSFWRKNKAKIVDHEASYDKEFTNKKINFSKDDNNTVSSGSNDFAEYKNKKIFQNTQKIIINKNLSNINEEDISENNKK